MGGVFYNLLTVLIIICCALIILVVLIQNPKGGGLGATFGGVSNAILGVKRTTDFLEKATWTLVIVLLALSLLTNFFVPKGGVSSESSLKNSSGTTETYQEQPIQAPQPVQEEKTGS